MTVLDLISGALVLLGEMAPGQTPSPEEQATGLSLLNTILSNWEVERRKVYIIDNLQFPLTDGKGKYTMGPGGDFDTYRPVKIEAAGVIITQTGQPQDGLRKALELWPSIEWAQIQEKQVEGMQPLRLYNDNDYPLLHLYVWPTPHIG